jgi:hypothetical protein
MDTSDGTTGIVELSHERDDIKGYYSQFQGEVIGIEACGYTNWFEELIERLGHKLQGRSPASPLQAPLLLDGDRAMRRLVYASLVARRQ